MFVEGLKVLVGMMQFKIITRGGFRQQLGNKKLANGVVFVENPGVFTTCAVDEERPFAVEG